MGLPHRFRDVNRYGECDECHAEELLFSTGRLMLCKECLKSLRKGHIPLSYKDRLPNDWDEDDR